MTVEHPVLLLDTNIWIDNYLENRKGCVAARELISYAGEKGFTLAYAATTSKDVFFLIKSELKRGIRASKGSISESEALTCSSLAWACLVNLTEIAVSSPIGEAQIWLAQHYRDLHDDYEDDLVLAAVETSKADYFVTNDKRLVGKSGAPSFTCLDMLAYLKMQLD